MLNPAPFGLHHLQSCPEFIPHYTLSPYWRLVECYAKRVFLSSHYSLNILTSIEAIPFIQQYGLQYKASSYVHSLRSSDFAGMTAVVHSISLINIPLIVRHWGRTLEMHPT